MRNAIINGSSPQSDIWGALTGTWEEVVSDLGKWSYTKTPFFVAVYGTFEDGDYALPFRFGDNVVATIAYADGTSESRIVDINQQAMTFSKNCSVQILACGRAANVRPVF